jgi:hypothetical protein
MIVYACHGSALRLFGKHCCEENRSVRDLPSFGHPAWPLLEFARSLRAFDLVLLVLDHARPCSFRHSNTALDRCVFG